MRVLNVDDLGFDHPGGRMFMSYLTNKESLAAQATSVALSVLGLGRSAMKSPLQALIQMGVVPPVTFPTDSRYYGFEHADVHHAERRRPSPICAAHRAAARRAQLRHRGDQHTVQQGDRLDLIAAKYLGDPLMFWLICDANGAIAPQTWSPRRERC